MKYATGYIQQLAFRSDGKQLAAACFTGARRWDLGRDWRSCPPFDYGWWSGVSYSADGRRLAIWTAWACSRCGILKQDKNRMDATPVVTDLDLCLGPAPDETPGGIWRWQGPTWR